MQSIVIVENPENKQKIIRRLIYLNLYKQLENIYRNVCLKDNPLNVWRSWKHHSASPKDPKSIRAQDYWQ